jgi:hypothetical protein
MATPYHLQRLASPGVRYTLRQAAKDNMFVAVNCGHCIFPKALFLATDLVRILDPERDALEPPFPCSICKKDDYVRVKLRPVCNDDVGHTVVRRLVRLKVVPQWRNEPL